MRSKLTHYSLKVLACCGIGLLLAALGPTIATACWHLAHSSVQRFDGYEIRVPISFIFRQQGNGVELLRAKPALSRSFYQFESIKITKHDGHIDLAKWRDAALRTTLRGGFAGVKAYDLQFGGSPAACVERAEKGPQVRSAVLCANNGDIYIQYFGDAQGIHEMRKVLQDVRQVSQ